MAKPDQTTTAAPTDNLALGFIKKEMKEMIELRDSFKEEQLKFVKNLVNKDLTDTELYLFLMFAGKIGLNPFKKEIIAIVYSKDNPTERRVGYIVTRDGKMVVARGKVEKLKVDAIYIKKVKNADGSEVTIPVEPWDGSLWGARATCEREGQPYQVTVPLAEYDTGRNVWASKKSTMIKKVAQSQLLSMAIPELLGGVWEEEEVPEVTARASRSLKAAEAAEEKPEVAKLPDGDKPATLEQLETLKALGWKHDEVQDAEDKNITKQQAAEFIKEAATAKKEEA